MRCLTIQQNKCDGDFHEIILENIVDFELENKVVLDHFKLPQDVIWARLSNMPSYPIANFKSRTQRDNVYKNIEHITEITCDMFYEQVFTDTHAFEYMKDYLLINSYRGYFKTEFRRFQTIGKTLIDLPVFEKMTYPDIERLANGSIVPYAELPSVGDLARTLKTPAKILISGIRPSQFFTHIINETYNIPFAV